ncbi:pyruvate dehydrogenase E2 component (dihydrolipoamide acetyltransferase) [Nocardiopsis sp. Huas11]|uniref:dihydrolipoamide acetyltransferase family protein n=1 Tax=Nocardiopsis sp. Huas11 TaxID=2183912 RepID=UPI000EACC74F|nr:dihydrolipoamide acetyltransferase family protein [Nocardiopsis sp. Huas11]RKS09958.1 pyruvate dehydrogenase E2 component (dihydrolipoamide acetyltransferase) [Nocardiopsis sp. Huas11]
MSTERSFALPDLGEGLTEAEILAWLVAEGDEVAVDQPVVEVETAKASVEVPCPYGGTVTRLHGSAGDTVAVGTPLITVAVPAPAAPAPRSGRAASPRSEPTEATEQTTVPSTREGSDPAGGNGAAEHHAGSGAVLVGYGTGSGARTPRRRARGAGGPPRSTMTGGPPPPPRDPPAPRPVRVISPLVRRMAREHGLDIATVPGSGEGGLVLRRDVAAAVEARRAAAHRPDPERTHRTPLRGGHRTMAEHLERSRREIPEATVWVDADATGLVELRRTLNEADPGRPVGVLALVARIAIAGLERFPELNAHFDQERREVLRFDDVHLGFAAQTPRGLVVPVVRRAQALSTRRLSARLAEAAEAARSGTLEPAALVGGTFTVNNYGVFGVDGSAAIIPHPQAAILGLGRIVRRPWVVGESVVPRPVTELTLAFDHRVCDGGVAGGFLRYVADRVERPELLLGDA